MSTQATSPQRPSPSGSGRAIRGRVTVELRGPDGRLVTRRRANNTVMRTGAELLGDLLRGDAGAIDGFAVGLDGEPSAPPYESTGLTTTTPGGDPLLENAVAPIATDQFEVETLAAEFLVRVRVRGVLAAGQAVSPDPDENTVFLGEAALGVLSEDQASLARIYNRVVFEPIPKSRDHELSLYWELDFPYGP
ncbi:hypothetical protein [Haliangium sp.]|uniref:hypothetical protein n=1 Tax=Haliangium sp. TaxID=2663208 RepID=UPI003D0A41BF